MATNIDPAIVEALRPWFEDDAPDAAHEVLQVIRPTIAAAVDAARAEGDKQGAARVRDAVEKLMLARFPDDGEPVLSITMPVSALLAAITEAAPHD